MYIYWWLDLRDPIVSNSLQPFGISLAERLGFDMLQVTEVGMELFNVESVGIRYDLHKRNLGFLLDYPPSQKKRKQTLCQKKWCLPTLYPLQHGNYASQNWQCCAILPAMLIARNPFPRIPQAPERNPGAMDLEPIHELGDPSCGPFNSTVEKSPPSGWWNFPGRVNHFF